jgi:hypothetical protein
MISLICPSRGRPYKCRENILRWVIRSGIKNLEVIVSIDKDDPVRGEYLQALSMQPTEWNQILLENETNSGVAAVNNAARIAQGDLFIVVSDDTRCPINWANKILRYVEGKKDFVLKVQDGIQPKMVTQPIMDRVYYQRDGWIYHPRFKHCFADQFLTDLAVKRKRLITKNIMFKHEHYSVSKSKFRDEQYARTDATFDEGRQIYKELKKEYGLPN